jgi:hypothetical protein
MDLSALWQQVDTLRALEKAPVLATDRRFALPDDPRMADDHVCGPMCPYIVASDSGDFTCTRSGMCFGRQIASGCNEHGQAFVDCAHNAPVVRTPKATAVGRPEIFSAACACLNRLVDAKDRTAVDGVKAVKARKNAFRASSTEFKRVVSVGAVVEWTSLLTLAASTYEATGGGVRRRVFAEDRRVDIACLLADIYQVLIIPYAKVDKKKPNKELYSTAMLYLLADGFGSISRVDSGLLMATLPSEKLLKSFGINISRVTAAKRYIKDALCYLNEAAKNKKRKAQELAT